MQEAERAIVLNDEIVGLFNGIGTTIGSLALVGAGSDRNACSTSSASPSPAGP